MIGQLVTISPVIPAVLQDLEGESEFFSLGSDKLDFWRATVGVTFRFR